MEKAVAERDASNLSFNAQMKEMVSTLEKYKRENEKIVDQKEKELEQIRKRLVDQECSKKSEVC